MRVRFTPEARRHIRDLDEYYARLGRGGASRKLYASLGRALQQIGLGSGIVRNAPGPYPDLADLGLLWLHVGRYWVAHRPDAGGHAVTGVFFDQANIPGRIETGDL